VKKNFILLLILISFYSYGQKRNSITIEPFVSTGIHAWTRKIDFSVYRTVDPNDPLLKSNGSEKARVPSVSYSLGSSINVITGKIRIGLSYSRQRLDVDLSEYYLNTYSPYLMNTYHLKFGVEAIHRDKFSLIPTMDTGLSYEKHTIFFSTNAGVQLEFKLREKIGVYILPNLSLMKNTRTVTVSDFLIGPELRLGLSYSLLSF
jgi:hypothetical protein